MPYTLTRAQLGSITDPEMAFSTDRLLPPWEEIPQEFRDGNIYTELVEAILYQRPLPDAAMAFRTEFSDPEAPAALNRCVRAHLQSFGPQHEHKIAGIAYLIWHVAELQQDEDGSSVSDQG